MEIKNLMNKIFIKTSSVIGAGNWGTAIAKLLGDKGDSVYLWSHDKDHVDSIIKHNENKKYLSGFKLKKTIQPTDQLNCVSDSQCIIMVVPSHAYREVFQKVCSYLAPNSYVVSAVKGIENDTLKTMSQITEEILAKQKKLGTVQVGVLSGPSFAEEVASRQPTAVTVAFNKSEAAESIQQLLATDYFRVYTDKDIIGLEISSAMKNVIAIAAGISDGLGFGLNTRAALITRGLAEITRLGVKLGADPLTFSGLGGLGDLVLTCTGNLSRNRTVGLKLGQGQSLKQILTQMTMVAEGIKTTKSCYNLAKKYSIEMPILEKVYEILYEDKECKRAVVELIQRDLKKEKQ